jgi:DNA-binding transcriptional ArsR family regulator
MRSFLTITRALNDQTRLRILLALRQSELCLCQLVDLFGLAPSTVSKHVNILYEAGLVDRRKDGRWAFFKLAGREAPPAARRAIRWIVDSLDGEAVIVDDERKLIGVMRRDLDELCECYS